MPLNQNAVEIIKRLIAKRYFGEDSPLVPDEKGNYSRPSGFRRQWESVLAYAGVEQKGQQCLRHTFATALVNGKKDENGVIHTLPLRQVADILGHSTSTITEKYYVKREMKKLRGITNKFQF